jgi:hypothetical protein
LRVIGEVKPVAAGLTLRWQDGRVEPLRPGGWEHFQRQGEGQMKVITNSPVETPEAGRETREALGPR